MATSNPAPVASYVYGMPQSQDDPCSSHLPRIKRTAIIQLIGGFLLASMGIVAIILMAFWSYYATAIWSGMVIFGVTGVIGMSAASTGNKCLIRAYLVLSIVGCLMGFALFEMHIFAAILEDEGQWHSGNYFEWNCQPGGYYSFIPNCAKSQAARQTFDALISITGFFLFILCIVSASYGCCASCKGCESCCKKCCCNGSGCSQCCTPPPPPVTAIFPPQGVTPGFQQAGMYIVQQGPSPVTQYQHVAMPPPQSTNQEPVSYIVMPAANQMPLPTQQSVPGMQPQPSNVVAPPSYRVAVPGHAQFPPVEQPQNDEKQ